VRDRYFTTRSLLLGVTGGLIVCAVAYPNDYLVQSTLFVGNHLPVGVFFLLFFVVAALRPFFLRYFPRLAPTNRELAVALAITFAACSLPTSSLMRYFPTMLTVPYDLYFTRQHWQTTRALAYTPERLTPEGWYIEGLRPELDERLSPEERIRRQRRAEFVNKGLRNGIVKGDRFVFFWPTGDDRLAIPWRSWLPVLAWWGPVLLFFLLMILGVMAVVHPQWSRNELLPYPIAEVTASVIRTEPGRLFPSVFYKRMFWIGFGITAFIHFVRWVYRWYPETMINIPLEWRLGYLIARKFPNFYYHGGDIRYLFNGNLYLSIVAFAFFVPTEVSFSLGITTLCVGLLTYVCWSSGASYTSYNHASTLFGAYAAMALIILYLGRRYYATVFRAALGLRTQDTVEAEAKRAGRIFLVGFVGLTVALTVIGLPLYMALAATLLLLVLFVVVARITAETGDPFIQAHWYPMEVISRLLGPAGTGPRTLSLLTLVSRILAQDVRECLSSFWINSLKICDKEDVPRARLSVRAFWLLIPCVLVAFMAAIWVNYNGRGSDGWGLNHPPRMTYDAVAGLINSLKSEPGLLEQVTRVDATEGVFSPAALLFRMRHAHIEHGTLPWMVFGFAAVMACSFFRIRYTWWFIHPVLFLAWGNYATNMFASSFFLGFVLKWAVVKYGGGRAYHGLKPLLIGVIMGELAMGGVVLAFNFGYFLALGINPVRYTFLPG